jgi:peptidyl-prolyl cis-trans isomerase SurA
MPKNKMIPIKILEICRPIMAALCLVGIICTSFGASDLEATEVVDRIVAIVNDEIISLNELNDALKPYLARIKQQGYTDEQARKILYRTREEVLNQLIDEKLTDQEIKRQNVSVSDEEIDLTIEDIKRQNQFTDETFRQALANEGLTIDDYRQRLKNQLLRSRLVNIEVRSKVVITDVEISNYYQEHIDEYKQDKSVHLRSILMTYPMFAGDATKRGIWRQMEQVHAELKAGKDFATLARRHSQASFAAEGGDLGTFAYNELSPQIQFHIKGLKAGEFSEIVESEQGLQIFYVEALSESQAIPLEEVSAQIESKLYNEIVDKAFDTWLAELRTQSHIKIVR